MIIVDAHQDIAYNALGYGRDYRKSAWDHRKREGGKYPPATVGMPDAILGRVALIFATLFTEPFRQSSTLSRPPEFNSIYRTPQEAYDKARQQLDYYQRLVDEDSRVRIVRTMRDLDEVLASWGDDRDAAQRLHGLVLLMENGDPILEPRQFEEWVELGVRLVGPAWKSSRYTGGTGEPGGLTVEGYDLLDVMASFNAILDLSHIAEEAFYQVLDRYEGTIIASHSNPRKFRNSDRHLTDDMIRKLSERDGVMGVVLYNRFLSDDWVKNDPTTAVTLDTVADAIDHICQITGSAAHVGIGSDFDGGFGADSIPDEMETTTDIRLIADKLGERGYSTADVEAIMSGNFLRKLRECLPE